VQAQPELLLKIAYDPRPFDDDTVGRMLGHLQTLLEAMAVNLDRRVGDLPLLSDSEKRQLLFAWNETSVHYSRNTQRHCGELARRPLRGLRDRAGGTRRSGDGHRRHVCLGPQC
jgi:non-ribosomal peptide synthetase component F